MPARLRRHAALVSLMRAFKPGTPGLGRRLAALPRLVRASLRGEYDAGARLLLMAAAALYIVSPLDALPEVLLGPLGLIDDAFVVTWLTGALLSETERFITWEGERRDRKKVVPGQIVGS